MRRASLALRLAVITVLPAVAATLLAACGSGPPTPPLASPSAAGLEPSEATASAGATTSPGASTVASPGTGLVVDPTLLDVLPSEVGGVPLTADGATALEISGDALLADTATAIAVALAIQPEEATADDLAIVSVIRLRDGVFSSSFFRDWRDTYDAAACEGAGGVDGRAQAQVGGRIVFIGTCAEGVRTYHTHLPARGVLVSVTSLGSRRFGEQVMASLTE